MKEFGQTPPETRGRLRVSPCENLAFRSPAGRPAWALVLVTATLPASDFVTPFSKVIDGLVGSRQASRAGDDSATGLRDWAVAAARRKRRRRIR